MYWSLKGDSERVMMRNSRRLMIGSTAPTCTYNECRGCKYRCRAEQVPVEGNDPVNSAYHYKCVCHSSSLKLSPMSSPYYHCTAKLKIIKDKIKAYYWYYCLPREQIKDMV
ncbi:epidermal patterning factor-like protein 9 [Quercus suber]|uniref:Epidermal patterning factor-like protein 9 n=1 Tax=Quercus suber TaxID=58331 RepID=A0AAW0M5V6_QUESU